MTVNHLHADHKVCVGCLSLHNCVTGSCHFSGWAHQGCMGVQIHLAVCCKATPPILCMRHVRVRTDHHARKRHLSQATRCLAKQPGGVSHLDVSSRDVSDSEDSEDSEATQKTQMIGYAYLDNRCLVDLRCPMLWYACSVVLQYAGVCPCFCCMPLLLLYAPAFAIP